MEITTSMLSTSRATLYRALCQQYMPGIRRGTAGWGGGGTLFAWQADNWLIYPDPGCNDKLIVDPSLTVHPVVHLIMCPAVLCIIYIIIIIYYILYYTYYYIYCIIYIYYIIYLTLNYIYYTIV